MPSLRGKLDNLTLILGSRRQRQISKFAFVQDRLREWRPDVLAKLERLACLTLASLDIDGFRIDKGLTITIDAQSHWSNSIRTCAKRFGKQNFFISGTHIQTSYIIIPSGGGGLDKKGGK